MFDLIKLVLHDCSTGIDGKTYNPVRIIGYSACAGAVLEFFGSSIYMVFSKATFDYTGFGSGFALLMGALLAVGATEAVKSFPGAKTEPPAGEPPKGDK